MDVSAGSSAAAADGQRLTAHADRPKPRPVGNRTGYLPSRRPKGSYTPGSGHPRRISRSRGRIPRLTPRDPKKG
ncbi:hypothetical protein FAIPA1_240038 [Frankia sp. AiPs1]